MAPIKSPAALALLLAWGCGPAPAIDYGDPTEGFVAPTSGAFLTIADPPDFASPPGPWATLQGEVAPGVTQVEVAELDAPYERASLLGLIWTRSVRLLHGVNSFYVRSTTADGRQAEVVHHLIYGGLEPGVRIVTPREGEAVATLEVEVRCLASATAQPLALEVVGGDNMPVQAVLQEDGSYGATVALVPGANLIVARVTDGAGRFQEAVKTIIQDQQGPWVEVDSPAPFAQVSGETVEVRGRAGDEQALAMVEVCGSAGVAVQAQGQDPFGAQVRLQPGWNTITVTATDTAGLTAQATVEVYRPLTVSLTPPDTSDEDRFLDLELGRTEIDQLMDDDQEKSMVLLYLDALPMMRQALLALREPEIYGIDTTVWGQAEWNMWGLLTMTPDTADLSGTSMEDLVALGNSLGLPLPRLIADLLNAPVDSPCLHIDHLVESIYRNVIQSHPACAVDPVSGEPRMTVTMYDGLRDMHTLAERYGPSGDHPGFLVGDMRSNVLLPSFTMTVRARSKLVLHRCIDADQGMDYLFVPQGEGDLLEFDFLNPETFKVDGIAQDPRVDLTFSITENPAFLPSGADQHAGPDGIFFQGDGAAWLAQPWEVERVVMETTYLWARGFYEETGYAREMRYQVGPSEDSSVVTWDKGWITVTTKGGLGNPPPPLYFWDFITELAQVRLHDQGLAEGEANVVFSVGGLPVGLTKDQIIEAMRPQLQAQRSTLSSMFVGDPGSLTSDCDLYLAGQAGALFLYFIAPEDIPGKAYPYTRPGFFADEALSDKISVTSDLGDGDRFHEKVAIPSEGRAIYYIEDALGQPYRLAVEPPDREGQVQVVVERASP